MGAKTFINQTGHDLYIELTVREGDEPGTAADVPNFQLANAQPPYFFQYSVDINPYLDGIIANATDNGNIAGELYVFTRGDDSDNAMNMNNTVTFNLQDQTIVLNCTNQ
jgi:hypothetical protein